jgi:Antistasin family
LKTKKMRLAFPLLALLSSWLMMMMMILDANADLHTNLSKDEEISSFVIVSSVNQYDEDEQQERRNLQETMPCPLGEHWNGAVAECVAVNCDSTKACTGFDETCQDRINLCAKAGAICPQFTCVTSCPDYEEKDPVTGECIPVYCSSPRACPAETGNVCLRLPVENCEPGRPCPNFRCCPDISQCDYLFCAYGRLEDENGCPMCDCKPCYGYYGKSGHGYVGGGNGRKSTFLLCANSTYLVLSFGNERFGELAKIDGPFFSYRFKNNAQENPTRQDK